MMERHTFEIARIYVPVKRAKTLDPAKVDALAEDMLERGQTTPISVRADRKDGADRYVLVEGLHRLEALKALGETTVVGFLVQARIRRGGRHETGTDSTIPAASPPNENSCGMRNSRASVMAIPTARSAPSRCSW